MQRKRSKRIAAVAVGACFAVVCLTVRLAVVASGSAVADPLDPDPADPRAVRRATIEGLLDWVRGAPGDEEPRLRLTRDGYIRFLGAPPTSTGFPALGANLTDPDAVARGFLSDQEDLFANPSPRLGFRVKRQRPAGGHTYVRLQQQYAGLDVYCGEATVMVDGARQIRFVLAHLMTDTEMADADALSLTPGVTLEEAKECAVRHLLARADATTFTALHATGSDLLIYEPDLLGQEGQTQLVWNTMVTNDLPPVICERVLVDAQTGQIAHTNSLIWRHSGEHNYGIYRRIYYGYPVQGDLRRKEGDDPVGGEENDYDLLYDFFGQMYEFLHDQHGRHGFADLDPSTTYSLTNVGTSCSLTQCQPGAPPWGTTFQFEHDYITDDVVGHEYTHAVLYYQDVVQQGAGDSGAINEALCDMWGEWFDQTYQHSPPSSWYGYVEDDTSSAEWLAGEDLDVEGAVVRNMKDPPSVAHWSGYPCPDVYKGQYWTQAQAAGVNDRYFYMCVGDKLCYLLTQTQGVTFHGFSVTGLDIAKASDLFYEAMLGLLTDSNYYELAELLITASGTLSFSDSEKLAVKRGLQAVNIREGCHAVFSVRDSSAATVAYFEEEGALRLKGALSTGQASIDTSNGGFILEDGATVVAYVDTSAGNGGAMKIKGTLTENTTPQTSADNILEVRDGSSNLVATIDKNGNLALKGEASPQDEILE